MILENVGFICVTNAEPDCFTGIAKFDCEQHCTKTGAGMVISTLQNDLMNDLKSVFYSCSEKIWIVGVCSSFSKRWTLPV